jgi:type IV pilus assembly protein PilB
MKNNIKLFNLLKEKKIIPERNVLDIEKLIKSNNDFDLSSYLIKERLVGPEKIAELKARMYNFPYENLTEIEIPNKTLRFISEKSAKNYLAICFDLSEGVAKVGLVEPNLKSMEAINFLGKEKGVEIEYYIISKSSFNLAFKKYRAMEEEISSALELKFEEEGKDFLEVKEEDGLDAINVEDVHSAPVAKIVSVIIKNAIDARASDIHIEPYENESRVRYRVDGILKNVLFLPKNIHNAVVARIKVLSKIKLDEIRIPQDGRIFLVFDKKEIDLRVSTFPVGDNKEKVVLRILDATKGIISLEKLGFNNYILDVFKRNIKKTNGIILVTGPTGSGKTTTLYSVMNILNQEGVNISTLEDPIEYQMKGVNQSQVRPKIGYSFATGLRSMVRQDPDIIMVGEIRDEETAELSVHAGLTGHLVLSTLHTNSALASILRLLDMGVERILLSSILRMIVSQRLARRLCDHCKKEVSSEYKSKFISNAKKGLEGLSEERILKEIPALKNIDDFDNLKIYSPVGCPRCQDTGYFERIAVGEIIEADDNLKGLIINEGSDIGIEKVKKSQEFVSIKQDGLFKVLNGQTNMEEILRVIES